MDMQVVIMYDCVRACFSKQQVLPQSASFLWPRATAGSSPVVLHTVVTLTPKVNTVCMCVFSGFITAYVTDWWSQWHMWWAPLPISPGVRMCVSTNMCVWLNFLLQYMNFVFPSLYCIFHLCRVCAWEGSKTPILPHLEILTHSLLDSIHPNILPPDCPHVTTLLHFNLFLSLYGRNCFRHYSAEWRSFLCVLVCLPQVSG